MQIGGGRGGGGGGAPPNKNLNIFQKTPQYGK